MNHRYEGNGPIIMFPKGNGEDLSSQKFQLSKKCFNFPKGTEADVALASKIDHQSWCVFNLLNSKVKIDRSLRMYITLAIRLPMELHVCQSSNLLPLKTLEVFL
jgi:hypothetical protein